MPKSTRPRKPYTKPRKNPKDPGAWDQLSTMITTARSQLRAAAEMSKLVAERDAKIGDVDRPHALALMNVLLRDTKTFNEELVAIEAAVAGRTGDVADDDFEGLMQTLQLASQIDGWNSRYEAVVFPTVVELQKIASKELA